MRALRISLSLVVLGLSAALPNASLAETPTIQRDASCWRDLAASFRDGPRQTYRPLIALKPANGNKLEFDWALTLGEAFIGARRVSGLPLAHLIPKGGFSAEAEYWNPRGKGFERCPIPAQAFENAEFQREWTYGGFRLDLDYRDTIEAKVTSGLDYAHAAAESRPEAPQNGNVPCQATNLHTHGLLVSPAQRADGTIGDFVLDLAQPAGEQGDVCADGAGNAEHASHHIHGASGPELRYRIEIGQRPPSLDLALKSPYHPPGVFWFHPHPHGYSAAQLRGATSGMITIGGAQELQRYAGFVKGPHNLRHMILRDAQIGKAGANGVFPALGAYDSGLCGDKPSLLRSATKNGGYLPGECSGPDGETWIFTVNGVAQPEMARDVEGNDTEVWRILNASSNASYLLALRPIKDGAIDPEGAQHCFRVIARDGVPAPEHGVCELLLMPGARAEIAIDPAAAGETYALVSEGVDSNGDFWPPVLLASVAWPHSAAATPERAKKPGAAPAALTEAARVANASLAEQHAIPVTPRAVTKGPAHWTPPQDICGFPEGSERVVLFVKKPGLQDPLKEVFGLVAGLRAAGDANWRQPGHSAFFRRNADGKTEKVDFADLLAALDSPPVNGKLTNHVPAFGETPVFSDICVDGKHSETWVLENWTDELHNFHIHQTRFQLAAANIVKGKPDPAYFATPFAPGGAAPCRLADDAAACFTPADALIAEGIADALEPAKTPPHHDSIPVPRGSADCAGAPASPNDQSCHPGRISITLAFDRDEQRGEHGAPGVFPYHCHILEHEDGGMMGLVTVK